MKHILILFCSFFAVQLVMTLKLKCDYITSNNQTLYGVLKVCHIFSNIISTSPNITIERIDAKEDLRKIKVLFINHENISSSSFHYIPNGIEKFLPNLKYLGLHSCGIKSLSKHNLKPFSKLQGLQVINSNITSLESGLFNYSSNLEMLSLSLNPIRYVEPGTFKPLTKLTKFVFNNLCHDQEINSTNVDEFEKEFEKIEENCNEKTSPNDPTFKIKIKCINNTRFANNSKNEKIYKCQLNYDINVTRRGVIIESVEQDVTEIFSLVIGYAKNLHYIPHGLAEFFPKLWYLTIGDSGLRELRSQEMEQFEDLHGLYLINTELKSLEKNTFKYTTNMRHLVIKGHKMKYVESRVFDVMTKLETLMFKDNQCVDKSYSKDSNRTKTILLLTEIYKRCHKRENDQMITLMRKSKT